MTKNRALLYGNTIPQDFLDTIQELLGTYISPNIAVSILNTNTVQIAAATDNAQISLAINGRWRFVTAAVNATHPGGAAGIYNLWATAADNSFTIGPPEVDNTVYTFSIQILASGNTPATALYRQIGTVAWNGTAITDANLLEDDPVTHGNLVPGDFIFAAQASRPGALLCDGSSYLRTTYPALFNAVGGASSPYGLADGTHFNVPDLRGRTLIGVGTGSGLTARVLGASGGEESHTLTAGESGTTAHTHPSGTSVSGTTSTSTTGTGLTGGGTTGAGSTGTGLTAASTYYTGGGTTGNEGAHTHPFTADHNVSSSFMGTGPSNAFTTDESTSSTGAGSAHAHSVPGLLIPQLTIPSLTVAGLSIPGLSIPALSIPSLSFTGTLGTIAAATGSSAGSSHQNMQPWSAAYVHIKF